MNGTPPGSSVHGFSTQEYWSGFPFPSPGDLPDPGIKPRSPALQAESLLSEPQGRWIDQDCCLGPLQISWWLCGILGGSNVQHHCSRKPGLAALWEPRNNALSPQRLCCPPKFICGAFKGWPECSEFCHHQEHRFYMWVGGPLILLKIQ